MKPKIGFKWFLILTLVAQFSLFFSGCTSTEEEGDVDSSGEVEASVEGEEEALTEDGEDNEDSESLDDELADESEEDDSSTDQEKRVSKKDDIEKTEEALFSTSATKPSASIKELKYLSQVNGGTMVIETSDVTTYKIRPGRAGNQHVIELQNVNLPDRFKRPFITKEFEGPFISFEAYQAPSSSTARILVQAKQGGAPAIVQKGNSIFISGTDRPVEPSQMEALAQAVKSEDSALVLPSQFKEEAMLIDENMVLKSKSLYEFLSTSNKFYGKKISIEVKNGDVRDVLNFIAENSGLNMIVDDQVTGTVSMKLNKIPWDQAMIIVLQTKRLGYIRQGNVLRIAPLVSLKDEAEEAVQILESRKRLEDLVMRVVTVSYADVTELQIQIKNFLSKERGQMSVDKRTSSIVITDTATNVDRVERLIRQLDTPPAQVLIEGKVVEAVEDFNREFGFNWNFSGEATVIGKNKSGAPVNLTPSLGVSPSIPSGKGLDLALNVGTLNFFGDVNASLAIAESESKVKILSSPRITAVHNEEAEIEQTTEIPFVTVQTNDQGTSGGTPLRKIDFRQIQLKLKVTPQVTADDSVMLKIDLQRDVPGAQVSVAAGDEAISISKRHAKTKVLVRNGQTAVIGGIYQNDTSLGINGVPFLKDLPILGYLFKYQNEKNQKNELLIFLTPRILAGPITSTVVN
ncbi:MAG: type IV pilus secretin PilQ [Pseudomonadota bacterium]|nr:type IV pilus secretin PilQ [Pseudomonadota bacterium]